MYYLQINEDKPNQLIYYCRKCGYEDTEITENTVLTVSKIENKNNKDFSFINKYTKYDPALPKINTILCPNKDCESNQSPEKTKRDIIYYRYDDIDLKYVYICTICDCMWNIKEML
jgi:hypothetical protein